MRAIGTNTERATRGTRHLSDMYGKELTVSAAETAACPESEV
jgi:hypothetical protein